MAKSNILISMRLKTSLKFAMILLLLSGCAGQPHQSLTGDLGLVISVEGLPSVMRNARPYLLAKQSRLFVGDVIMTDDNASVILEMLDNTQISLAPNSRLLIRRISSNGREFKSLLTLNEGSMEISALPGGSSYQTTIAAATANIALISGDLWINHRLNGTLLDVVLLKAGAIQVQNSHGSITLRSPMESTTVPSGAAPRLVTKWSEQKFESIRQRRFNIQ